MWLSYTTPSMFKVSSLCIWYERALDFMTRTRTSTRYNLKFLRMFSKRRHPAGKLHFPLFTKKLVLLFTLKEVKPSPDSKMIKLLTFEQYNLFPPLRHSR